MSRRGKPKLTPEAARLELFFQLYCIELILAEAFIADCEDVRDPRFKEIKNRFRGKSRNELAEVGQNYLQLIWKELGFRSTQIDYFNVMLQNAKQILSEAGSPYKTLTEFRHALRSDLEALLQQGHATALVEALEDKLRLVQVFCKAHIRARQSSSIQSRLGNLPQRGRDAPTSEPGNPLADKVHAAHQIDPDLEKTAISGSELYLISAMSGVVATDVYRNLAKLNRICEAWAFLYWWPRSQGDAFLHLTPALVETWVHREALKESGEQDRESAAWELIFGQAKRVGLNEVNFRVFHKIYDENKVLDTPPLVVRGYMI